MGFEWSAGWGKLNETSIDCPHASESKCARVLWATSEAGSK
jgi:hypothetical protein